MKDKSSQGIVLDEKSQEQPKDKDRAQTAHKSKPGHMPQQPVKKDDELQPLRDKSGFWLRRLELSHHRKADNDFPVRLALRPRLQLTAKPAACFSAGHRIDEFDHNLMDVIASRGTQTSGYEARGAACIPRQLCEVGRLDIVNGNGELMLASIKRE
jgi:hypothetical protein